MASDSEDDANLGLNAVFTEPPRPATPPPTYVEYHRDPPPASTVAQLSPNALNWNRIQLKLVGTHPLWAHHLWNASIALAQFFDQHPDLYLNRNVLELGAGGALPSLVAVKNGAKQVVITDYPDSDLVNNIRDNAKENLIPEEQARVQVEGYIWGQTVKPLLDIYRKDSSTPSGAKADLVILSDLIFNHSQHEALLRTCENVLAPPHDQSAAPATEPCVLVFYTHHRPHLAHRDMGFFDMARERGWSCQEVVQRRFAPMFPEDSGDSDVRSTVHGWKLTRIP